MPKHHAARNPPWPRPQGHRDLGCQGRLVLRNGERDATALRLMARPPRTPDRSLFARP
jgi:hypothetical protein